MSRVSRTVAGCLVVMLWGGVGARADSSLTTERRVTQLAEGVYAIRHPDAPDAFPQSNTTVVIGRDAVLVVDSCYLPSAARQDIAQIRQWTQKPVRYLLNTHWHYDHTMGNAAYRDAFPGLSVIAHTETRNQIAGYNPGWFARYPDRGKQFQAAIDSGQDPNGRALSESEVDEYRAALAGLAPVGQEYAESQKRLAALTPDTAFEQGLSLDLGGREVRILFLGRGNTAGDAVAFLPKERILAAGDLVVHPVPYLGGGYPSDFPATLRRLKELDPAAIVPGHGDVLQSTEYLDRVAGFIATVVAKVNREIGRLGNSPRNLDEVQKTVEKDPEVLAWRGRFALDDAGSRDTFDGFSLPGVIRAAFGELVRR
jgi:glyoxylase-like metal-dependent hydrolase (beta-lactamase superfamily II)